MIRTYLSDHIQKLRKQAELVSCGIRPSQATRIIFNDSFDIKMADTFAEQMAVISCSLTTCVVGHFNMIKEEDYLLDLVVMQLEDTRMGGQIHRIFCHEGVWFLETGTHEVIAIPALTFDDRLILLRALEIVLQ